MGFGMCGTKVDGEILARVPLSQSKGFSGGRCSLIDRQQVLSILQLNICLPSIPSSLNSQSPYNPTTSRAKRNECAPSMSMSMSMSISIQIPILSIPNLHHSIHHSYSHPHLQPTHSLATFTFTTTHAHPLACMHTLYYRTTLPPPFPSKTKARNEIEIEIGN